MKYRILLGASGMASISAYMFWQYLPVGSFYILTALAWVGIFFLMLLITIDKIKDRVFKYMVLFCLLTSFNNLLDETIYQNFKLTNAEIIVSILITLILTTLYVLRINKSKR